MASDASSSSSSSSSVAATSSGDFTVGSIRQGSRGVGSFKIGPIGVGWKPKIDGDPVGYPASEIQGGFWRQIGPDNFEMALLLKGGSRIKFSGFKQSAFEGLSAAFPGELEESPVATSGHNWGELTLKSNTLALNCGDRPAFELPLADVAHSSAMKNEMTIKFHEYSTVDKKGVDMLTEIRFFVSPTNRRLLNKLRKQQEESGEEPSEDDKAPSAAQMLKTMIDKGSNQMGPVKQAFVTFTNIRFVAPRSRYELEFFDKYFTIKGPSSLWKILYESVVRLHYLPYKQDSHLLIFTLSPPLRKGATPYPQIIAEFREADEEVNLEVGLPRGSLPARLTGHAGEALCQVCEHYKKHPVRQGRYVAHDKENPVPFVRCSVKANDGVLYILDQALFFVVKPATYIRFEDIKHVEFTRADSTLHKNNYFDLKITLKKGGTLHEFNLFHKAEFDNIYEALNRAGVLIKGTKVGAASSSVRFADDVDDDDDDDEDDEEYTPGQEDEDDDYVDSPAGSGGESDRGSDDDDDDDDDDEGKQSSKRSRTN